MKELSYSEWVKLINEWIFDETHRTMLKKNLLDGWTYGRLAEKYNYSYRHVARLIPKLKQQLFKHL